MSAAEARYNSRMAKLTVIVGLPGSGKTETIKRDFPTAQYSADDFMANSHSDSPNFNASRKYDKLVEVLKSNKDCVVSDITFCRTVRRQEFNQVIAKAVPNVSMEWQFYANDADQCRKNVNARSRASLAAELAEINKLSPTYEIPANAKPLPVWKSA